MRLGGNRQRGQADIQRSAGEGAEVIVRGSQGSLTGRDRVIPIVHTGCGRATEAGQPTYNAYRFVIHKPCQRGSEGRENLPIKRLTLVVGRHAELGLVDGQGAGGEGGEGIVGRGQGSQRRGDGVVRPRIFGRGSRAAVTSGTGHTAGGQGLVIHEPGECGGERREDLAVIGLGLGIGSNAELGLVDRQRAGVEGGEGIVGRGQRTDCWCGRITASIHTGGGRTAEAGGTGHATGGQGLIIHEPGQRGRKCRERLAVISLGLGVGRDAQLGLVNGQAASSKGGEGIVCRSQRALRRCDSVVNTRVCGSRGRATITGGTGHTAGRQRLIIHETTVAGGEWREGLAVIGLGLCVGGDAKLGLVDGQGAGGEGGEGIVGRGQGSQRRGDGVVRPRIFGRGSRAAEAGGTGHTAGS